MEPLVFANFRRPALISVRQRFTQEDSWPGRNLVVQEALEEFAGDLDGEIARLVDLPWGICRFHETI